MGLADGIRLCVALSGPDAELPRPTANRPSATMVSSVLGRAVQPSDDLGDAHWRKLAGETVALPACVKALSETGVDLVVIIGSATDTLEGLWPQGTHAARPATFVEATGLSPETASDDCSGFAAAVALAYEAGAPVAFAGLFTGESRRKVSLPSYPFQRRSFWVGRANP